MKPNDIAFYKDLFVHTANDYLENLSKNLASLKEDLSNKELINNIHIAFHSLGSQSFAMKYQSTSAFCRMNEALLFKIKENKILISNELIDELLKSVETIKNSVSNIDSRNEELDLSNRITSFEKELLNYQNSL